MDVLVPGQGAELLDAGLHVVACDPFTRGDRGQIDLVDHGFVVGDDAIGHVDAEVGLRSQHGEPEAALLHHLLLG